MFKRDFSCLFLCFIRSFLNFLILSLLFTGFRLLKALKSYRLDKLEHDRSQYQIMREQCFEQLETQQQEQNRDRPRSRASAAQMR